MNARFKNPSRQVKSFVSPIRSQALWLAQHLEGQGEPEWTPPAFTPIVKVHDFKVQPAPAPSSSAATARRLSLLPQAGNRV